MLVFLFWVLFSAGIGYMASENGRSPAAWGIASLVLSPIIAAIGLVIAEVNTSTDGSAGNGSTGGAGKRDVDAPKQLSVEELLGKISKYRDLMETDMISEEEFEGEKDRVVNKLKNGYNREETEDVLLKMRDMRDSGALSKADVEDIKAKIL